MKIHKILLISFLLFGFIGCSDEFLEQDPIATTSEVSFYTSFERLDYTATAAYAMMVTMEVDKDYVLVYQVAQDDFEAGGSSNTDFPACQHVDRLTHTPNETDIWSRPYGYWYKGIRLANSFLERVEDVVAEDESVDMDVVNQRIAEMKYMRAFYHFLLVSSFGGVPIADQTVDPDAYDLPRDNIADVLHFIQDDLLAAIPDLKLRSELGDEYGRASKGAAQALLAKAYLYESSYAENYSGDDRFGSCENKYAEALEYAEAVMQSGEYELLGINGERYDSWRDTANGVGGYRYIFTLDGDNSTEGVFEAQNVADGRDWMYTRGSYLTVYTTIRNYYADQARTIERSGGDEIGWSFICPTDYLIAAYGNQDVRETGLNSAEVDPYLDPRFSTTIGCGDTLDIIGNDNVYTKPWDTVYYIDGSYGEGWYPMSFTNLPTGAIHRKYECSPEEFWDNDTKGHQHNSGPVNVKYIRYADVVLFAAEAAYKTSNTSKALEYVNMVRTRARMSGDSGYPEDLTAISFEDIIHERRLELACEPARFPDLVRWGLAKYYIDGIQLGSMGEEFEVSFVEGKHEFMPLDASDVQLNDLLEQYPGWD